MYYLLLFFGFLITSFIIYNKFIRTRLPKEIPLILTERYFWILLYICCLYIYVIKNLLKLSTKKPDETLKSMIEFFFMPLTTLDHFIKYNRHIKENYYKFMDNFILHLNKIIVLKLKLIIILFQILPRILLVGLLTRDVFYFETIEIFYKYLLLGFIPFVHRYIKYSIKDIKEHYISELELKYECIYMWDTAYNNPYKNWELTEENKYHQKEVPIKEYFAYKFLDKNNVEYDITVIAREDIYNEYLKKNQKDTLTENDNKIIDNTFYSYTPKIIIFNIFYEKYAALNHIWLIKVLKILIFGGYLICWGYLLVVSFYAYPLTFVNIIEVLIKLSTRIYEPFSNISLYEDKS